MSTGAAGRGLKGAIAAALVAVLLGAGATPARGQTAPPVEQRPAGGALPGPRGYLAGFGGLFAQPVGYAGGHYLSQGVGGNGLGVGIGAGAFITPHWSVAAEAARGPQFSTDAFSAGRIHYRTRYRDTLVSALVRWHPWGAGGGPSVEPVAGVTLAVGHAPRTTAWRNWDFTEQEPVDSTITRVSFGVGGGADLVIPAGRVAGVLSFRLHLLDRNDERDGQPPELGVGRFVYVLAGGLRWTF
ncbi:MAG TPA: hypothetical protein VK911_15495 [Vicinamibacterales bacterium]|nr:hypothetical protein [Vicinamibacterales bacterium]